MVWSYSCNIRQSYIKFTDPDTFTLIKISCGEKFSVLKFGNFDAKTHWNIKRFLF